MSSTPQTEPSLALDPALWTNSEAAADIAINPLDVIHFLRSAGGGLLAQATLYGELAKVEWALEKRRLTSLLLAALVGFAFLLCTLLLIAVLVLVVAWDTPYRTQVALALIAVYGLGFAVAGYRFHTLSVQGALAFAVIQEELSIDLALLKNGLLQSKL